MTSGTERALIARRLLGGCIVLATDSVRIADAIDDAYCSDDAGDVLNVDPDTLPVDGVLFLWEGAAVLAAETGFDGTEPYWDFRGTCRPVSAEELPALLALRPAGQKGG